MTVVVVGEEGADAGDGADAGAAFAAGVASATAATAAEDAQEALQAAEDAQHTADAALSVAIDSTLQESTCCAHCLDQRGEIDALAERLAHLEGEEAEEEHIVEELEEPAPEKVESHPHESTEPKAKASRRYGSKTWFG